MTDPQMEFEESSSQQSWLSITCESLDIPRQVSFPSPILVPSNDSSIVSLLLGDVPKSVASSEAVHVPWSVFSRALPAMVIVFKGIASCSRCAFNWVKSSQAHSSQPLLSWSLVVGTSTTLEYIGFIIMLSWFAVLVFGDVVLLAVGSSDRLSMFTAFIIRFAGSPISLRVSFLVVDGCDVVRFVVTMWYLLVSKFCLVHLNFLNRYRNNIVTIRAVNVTRAKMGAATEAISGFPDEPLLSGRGEEVTRTWIDDAGNDVDGELSESAVNKYLATDETVGIADS